MGGTSTTQWSSSSAEFGQKDLKTSHRLDRLTSGLLIFAKHLGAAQRIEAEIRDRKVEKEYVCRVAGEFPETPVECSEPILVVCKKLGVCKVDPAGKPCSTLFTRISYNGTSSVVTCVPRTGRMHQIRVHLQWLGYPIVNDPLYNNKAWGPKCGALGKGAENMEQVIREITALNYSSELSCVQEVTADYKQADLLEDSKELVVGKNDEGNVASHHPDSTGMACGNCATDSCSEVTTTTSSERGQVLGSSCSQFRVVQCLLDNDSNPTPILTSDSAHTPTPDPMPTTDPALPTPATDPTPTPATDPTPTPATDPTPMPTTDPTPTPATDPTPTPATDPTPTPATDPTPTPGPTPPMSTIDPTPTWTVDPSCTECAVRRPDPEPKDLVMYLHAVSYKGPNWEYRTDLPYWASEYFNE